MSKSTNTKDSIGHEHIVGGKPCKICGKITKSAKQTTTNTKNIIKYGEVYVVLNEYMNYISTSGHDGDGEFTSGQVIKPSFRGFKEYVDKMFELATDEVQK